MPKSKKEFIVLLAKRMKTDEETDKLWIDAYSETLLGWNSTYKEKP